MTVVEIFLTCHRAIRGGALITRASGRDKEFHFQDWFAARLNDCRVAFDDPGRNSYPDFRLVNSAEGFEIKGLAFPGREANYDCNSQVPSGLHNGRRIYYVFGRYPKDAGASFPVYDLVICDGDFLNADHVYRHKNRNIKGFGSYGDLMIRDRKMYVAPTPFALTNGTAGQITLILRADEGGDEGRLRQVGNLEREETEHMVTGYTFNLLDNSLEPRLEPNPDAGRKHRFCAYRALSDTGSDVCMNELADDAFPEGNDDELE
jgi:hypothetical protein